MAAPLVTVTRTPLSAILPALVAQVQAITGFPAERVGLVGRNRQPPHFQGDQDVYLRPLGVVPPPEWQDAAGRVWSGIKRLIRVVLRTRFEVDTSGRDDALLLDPVFGHLALEELVLNALQGFMPRDSLGNILVYDAVLLSPSPDTDLDPEPAPGTWVQTTFLFEINYAPALDQTRVI